MPTLSEVLGQDDPFAGMSPIDQLKLRFELRGKETVTPDQRAKNLRQTGEEILGIIPGPANVLAARDAYNSAGDASAEFGKGNYGRGALSAALAGLSGVGAVMGLPTSKVAKALAKDAPNMAFAFPAWHGTKHDFDKFDMSKLGTGEGAQMYGHGLYFAENPEVARSYQSALGGTDIHVDGNPFFVGGQKVGSTGDQVIDDALVMHGDIGAALNSQLRLQHSLSEFNPEAAARMEGDIAKLRAYQGSVESKPGGHLYKTEIDAEPDALLDWDKPLRSQGKDIQKAVESIFETAPEMDFVRGQFNFDKTTGGTAFDWIQRGLGPERASQALREAGVPGIRFLDQGSRGGATGTSNYVIFDDSLIKILGKE